MISKRLADNVFFFSSRRRHTILQGDWSSDVCSSDLAPQATHLLVTPGRAAAAVQQAMASVPATEQGAVTRHALQPCPQPQFDEMLWACDLNLVRGEDSLVRALWAGQPLVWHIYPQHDDAHHDKLDAFLDWRIGRASLRAFHHAWNGMAPASTLPAITPALLKQWQECVQAGP